MTAANSRETERNTQHDLFMCTVVRISLIKTRKNGEKLGLKNLIKKLKEEKLIKRCPHNSLMNDTLTDCWRQMMKVQDK